MTTLSNFTQDSSELSEIILCLVLWMGGDAAIFNSEELIYYLPYNKDDIERCLEEFENTKIVNKQGDDYYSLTKKGSFLADYSLIKLISTWAYVSRLKGYSKYQTIHHGFLMYSRNIAISNLFRSSRSFVTDYFQIVLENLVEKYSDKDISYFKDFRKILIRISLNPISDFVKNDNENYKEILNSFFKEEIIKAIDYKSNEIIVINVEYLKKIEIKRGEGE